jgi:hypothetical protein
LNSRAVVIAMQKFEGSNPFSRFDDSPAPGGTSVIPMGRGATRFIWPAIQLEGDRLRAYCIKNERVVDPALPPS